MMFQEEKHLVPDEKQEKKMVVRNHQMVGNLHDNVQVKEEVKQIKVGLFSFL